MVRWFKLFGDQYFGFWVPGVVLFAIQEIPYMVMPLFRLETNPIMNMVETSAALDVCEKVLGSLCIALMLFVVHKDAVLFSISEWREKLYFTLALIVLLANFFGWGLYFAGHQSVFVMMLFNSGHAAAVLCGRRALEAECTAGGHRGCVFGGAFHARLWKFEGHLTPEVK